MSSRPLQVAVALVGAAVTVAVVFAVVDDPSNQIVFSGLLLAGPAWCGALALASDETDFADAPRTREQWLAVLPWTFVGALLVVPGVVLLAMFLRESRADGGHSPWSADRMRPGEADHDHHWP